MASPPFDNPKADTILRTSDNIILHVHSVILIEASSIFADMFSMPQPENDLHTTPIISVTENAQVLDATLRYCYPVAEPSLTADTVHACLETALKYDIQKALGILRTKWIEFAATQPLHFYFVAHRHGWESETREAARLTLAAPIRSAGVPMHTYTPELESTAAVVYYRLLQYHRTCADAASRIWGVEFARVYYTHPERLLTERCTKCFYPCSTFKIIPDSWMAAALPLDMALLLAEQPVNYKIRSILVDQILLRARGCSNCHTPDKVITYCEAFMDAVHEAFLKVCTPILTL